jgi:glycosyltransferase involved in cell wall biosynthesis
MRLQMLLRDTYPPARPDVEILFGRRLPQLGIYSDLVTQRTEPGPASVEAAWGGGAARVCAHRAGARAGNMLADLWHDIVVLARPMKRYDAIQVRDKVFVAGIALLVARLRGQQFFYWMSFPFPEAYLALIATRGRQLGAMRWLFNWLRGQLGYWLLYRIVLPRSDHVFVQSERMQSELSGRGIPAARMTAVPMGVEFDLAQAVPMVPARSDRRVIVYLGATERQRRTDFLLEVVALLREHYPTILLRVIGDSSEPSDWVWLRQRATELGVTDCVEWCGWLPTREAWRAMQGAEIGLSPIPPGFLFDVSSPTKLVEYLALGLPAIANGIPDQAQVIAESGAGLCVAYEPAAFATGIKQLLADPQKRDAMRAAGPRYVAAHRSYAVLADRVAARYRALLGDNPRPTKAVQPTGRTSA